MLRIEGEGISPAGRELTKKENPKFWGPGLGRFLWKKVNCTQNNRSLAAPDISQRPRSAFVHLRD